MTRTLPHLLESATTPRVQPLTVVLSLIALFALIGGIGIYRLAASVHDYNEAEPLAAPVRALAPEMKRFEQERGRPATSLDELAAFAPWLDLEPLRPFRPVFTAGGPDRFSLRVNDRYSLVVTGNYTPIWGDSAPR